MNDSSNNIIVDTATRIFQDLCGANTVNEAEQGVWPRALWDALEESGLTLTWVPDELGGAGAALADVNWLTYAKRFSWCGCYHAG